MFAAKLSLRNYACRRQLPRGVMSSAGNLLLARNSVVSKSLSTGNDRPMSSMMEAEEEEESHFALILGKPGGGKGTISGKILKVRNSIQFKSNQFKTI